MFTFKKNPPLAPMYLRAALAIKKPKTTDSLPKLEARMENEINQEMLAQYNEVCEINDPKSVPITFPYALGGSLQLWLWTRNEFPVRVIGAVHVRNLIESYREIKPDEKLELRVRTGECRQVRLGTEHDVITELLDASGKVVWKSVSTNMAPGKAKDKKAPSTFEEPAFNESCEFLIPKGIGLRYGKICRDLNPIHLHMIGARFFGFKTPIAHGMWAMARSLRFLERKDGRISSLVVRFRKPIPIGLKVKLHFLRDGNKTHFALKNLKGDITHLEGEIHF